MKYFLLLLFIIFGFSTKAQMYYQNGRQVCCGDSLLVGNHRALGINPANLGRSGTIRKSFGLLQLGGSYYTDGLDLKGLATISFSNDSLTQNFKKEWLNNVLESEKFTFTNNLEMEWLSFAIASEDIGGIAFYLKDRISSFSNIPGNMLSLMLLGQASSVYQQPVGLSAAGNGTDLFYSHIREVALGYGRKVFKNEKLALYAGVSFKKLWGIGYFRTNIEEGLITGLSSFSNLYKINYGQLNLEKNLDRKLLDASGQGQAIDFGLAADIAGKFHIAASVTDIGDLSWEEQVLSSRTNFEEFANSLGEGIINSAHFSEELKDVYQFLNFEDGENFQTPLNTQLRLNTMYRTSYRLSLSTDLILPLNKNEEKVLNFQPAAFTGAFSWDALPGMINISSGLFYSELFGFRLPLGVSVRLQGKAMFSISTADLLTFLIDSKDPYAGISISTFNYNF